MHPTRPDPAQRIDPFPGSFGQFIIGQSAYRIARFDIGRYIYRYARLDIGPYIQEALLWLSENLAFSFVIGMFYGVFMIDLAHSVQLTARMRAFANEHNIIVRYEDVKLHIRHFRERAGMRAYFMFAFRSELPIVEHLKEAHEAWEERKKTNS